MWQHNITYNQMSLFSFNFNIIQLTFVWFAVWVSHESWNKTEGVFGDCLQNTNHKHDVTEWYDSVSSVSMNYNNVTVIVNLEI